MNSNHSEAKHVGVELKYCEHCGGLWVRERGAGLVYCEKCRAKVAELPVPKKKPGRIRLPEGQVPHVEVEGRVSEDELREMQAVGGVA